ncbi:Uncharacterised protein [uncultured archaeon]|nr:Uncharacterised protein [uncultured archaeon]
MTYKIFTLKGCHKCEEVKEYLKEKNIPYEEVNIGFGDGKKEFNEFYSKNRDIINQKRTADKTINLPIISCEEKIFQGLEEILHSI